MDELISDFEALCYDKESVSKMKSKIVELKKKLNKLSPLSQQVNILYIYFHKYVILTYSIFDSKMSMFRKRFYSK